jgi:uncharacterized protein DUF642
MQVVKYLFCLGLGLSATAQANLIVNGDFENPGAAYTNNYAAIASNTLPGWTSTVGNGVGPANYYSAKNSTASWIPNPQNGNYSVQLDSSTDIPSYSVGGALSQTISLTANTPYVLSFYMSAETATLDSNNNQVGCTSQIDIILNGGGFVNQNMVNTATGTTGFRASWTGANKADPEPSWVQWTLTFTPASSGNVTITFQDVWVSNQSSSNASLDNIDLVAVPELTHWYLYSGFAALAVSVNIRKTRRAKRIAKSAI